MLPVVPVVPVMPVMAMFLHFQFLCSEIERKRLIHPARPSLGFRTSQLRLAECGASVTLAAAAGMPSLIECHDSETA